MVKLPQIMSPFSKKHDTKIQNIIDFISCLSRLEFKHKLENKDEDELDIIAEGLNWLAEELDHSVTSKELLEQKNKELEQFAYIISHDLKAPLRGISTLASFIDEDLKEKNFESINAYLKIMQQRVQKIDELIEGILEYSRIGKTSKELIDTYKVISEIAAIYQFNQKVKIDISSDLPLLELDKTQFEQLCINLISNAIKHNDKEIARVTISGIKKNDLIGFSVKDNGPGIAKKYHHKIFELFQTLNDSYSNDSTGIGLTIVEKIVKINGGSIELKSKLDVGTTFNVLFPKPVSISVNNKKSTLKEVPISS